MKTVGGVIVNESQTEKSLKKKKKPNNSSQAKKSFKKPNNSIKIWCTVTTIKICTVAPLGQPNLMKPVGRIIWKQNAERWMDTGGYTIIPATIGI